MSVYENVAYRLVEHYVPEAEVARQVSEVLKFVAIAMLRSCHMNSRVMRRRLEIARAPVGHHAV